MNPEINDSQEAPQPANAVSIFGSTGNSNDFPVLKAFQEYIDAEQVKARKRMLGLSVFFILLLVVVVVTFTLVMTSVINRNQTLSDRLLDIALREKPSSAQPVVNVQQPVPQPVVQPLVQPMSQAEALKPVLEKFDKLAETLAKNQVPLPMAAPAPVVVTTAAPSPVVQQPSAESQEVTRLREELRREKEARESERKKAEEDKRQAEKEAFLRRQYPDYYARQDRARSPTPLPSKPQSTVQGMQPISYFDNSKEDPELEKLLSNHKSKAQKKTKAAANAKTTVPAQQTAAPAQKAIPQNQAAPAQRKKKGADSQTARPEATKASTQSNVTTTTKTEAISIGGSDGSSIPWLIEQPKANK